MILSYEWLKEFVKTKLTPEKLAEKLTLSGLEVESVETHKNFSKVVIGEVKELGPHPNADRLHLTKVDTGRETLDIVCGANNLSVGIKVPVALVGAKIDGFEIKKASLRGVESNGMICSEKELGLGEDHSGILILPKDAPLGKNLEDYLDFDAVIDVAVPANRPDCVSVLGLAREAAAATGEDFHEPKINLSEVKEKTENVASVEVLDTDLCPRYVARVVTNLSIKPSPDWLQKRLSASGVRPINNLVDISNYVMLEYGQPLHFFDLGKIAKDNHKAKIIVRRAKEKENIVTLDGVKRDLPPDTLVIADPKGAVAIAGIMGGANTEVDDKTKDILVEAAVFEKASIRKSAKLIGLRSEAVGRFEKGLPLSLPEVAADRACELLAELAGGKVLAGRIDCLSKWIWIQHIGLKISKLKAMLGANISDNQILDIFDRLGFTAEKFDIVKEAKKHLGKPYLFGANFKEHRTSAFDCSYLTDYIYSLIGLPIGHTSLGQLHHGREVKLDDLRPGDNLFYKGHIENSAVSHYYVSDGNGNHEKKKNKEYSGGVGHNGMYIGGGQVIHASSYDYDEKAKKWQKKEDSGDHNVHIVPLERFTKNPEFLGARRYAENLDDYIAVTVPWWREDVKNEFDLYEEIARIWGYDKVPAKLPVQGGIKPVQNKEYKLIYDLKKFLAGIGLSEITTYSFQTAKEAATVGPDHPVKVVNPIVKGRDILRTSLIPNMLSALSANQFSKDEIKFFEVSRVFKKGKGKLPDEPRMVCGGFISCDISPLHYKEGQEFYAAKGVLEALLGTLDSANAEYKEVSLKPYQEGRSAQVQVEGKKIGYIGEIDKVTLSEYDLKKKVAIFEVNLDQMITLVKEEKTFSEISRYQSVTRDLSVLFKREFEVEKALKAIKESDQRLGVEIINVYEGKPFNEEEKSVTFRFIITDFEKTMTDDEVEKIISKCQNKIEKLGGNIRGGRS